MEHSWTHSCVQWCLVHVHWCALSTRAVCWNMTPPKVMLLTGRVRKNYEKRLLASSRMSVRPSIWNYSAPNGRTFMKSQIWEFF
jgi:hypothetical protein